MQRHNLEDRDQQRRRQDAEGAQSPSQSSSSTVGIYRVNGNLSIPQETETRRGKRRRRRGERGRRECAPQTHTHRTRETTHEDGRRGNFLLLTPSHSRLLLKPPALTLLPAHSPLPRQDQGDNVAHDHQGRERTSRGARRHRAWFQSGEVPGLCRQVGRAGEGRGER